MTKYLVAIDLDGTALYDIDTMTDLTVRTLKEIKNKGHEVVISTGRAFRTSIHFYNLLELTTPIINHNGALISNPSNMDSFNKVEYFIPFKDVIDIFESNKEYIENSFAEYLEDYYVIDYNDWIKRLINPDPNSGKVIEGNYTDTLKNDVNGFLIVAKEGMGDLLERSIKETYKGYLDCRNWGGNNSHIIEVFLEDVSKGAALTHVCNHLDIDMKNVLSFGDGKNDVSMIEVAGIGIAMENAVEEAKDSSDLIIGHHQEDALANYLIEFFDLKEVIKQ